MFTPTSFQDPTLQHDYTNRVQAGGVPLPLAGAAIAGNPGVGGTIAPLPTSPPTVPLQLPGGQTVQAVSLGVVGGSNQFTIPYAGAGMTFAQQVKAGLQTG